MMMAIPPLKVKRYSNRKLYDTEAKRYITLNDIAAAIRQGRQVEVRDHGSGEDLTAQVLTQIVLAREIRGSVRLPLPILTGLVRAGSEALESLRATLPAPREFFQDIDEEIENRVAALKARGELAEDEARRLLDWLLERRWFPGSWETRELEALENVIEVRGVPKRSQLQELAQKIEAISEKLDKIQDNPG